MPPGLLAPGCQEFVAPAGELGMLGDQAKPPPRHRKIGNHRNPGDGGGPKPRHQATAAQVAASITFLLSADGTNVNGAILASDGGWSAV